MVIENWDEIRTAYHVARLGTVSGAAQVMGVHHATVIRHIDALEERLGTRLFQRHARGYTPTEAGQELMKVAQATDEQFAHLSSKITGSAADMAGELIVTSLPGLAWLISPTLARLQSEHPQLTIRYMTEIRVFRLEFGEAHVAVRAGSRPQEPDNVVQPLVTLEMGLYASRSYADRHGLPQTDDELSRHRFVAPETEVIRAPFYRWLLARVAREALVFRSNDTEALERSVAGGTGLGFVARAVAQRRGDLIEVQPPREEWASPLWLVTHVDLHRTPKIQALLAALKHDVALCAEGGAAPR